MVDEQYSMISKEKKEAQMKKASINFDYEELPSNDEYLQAARGNKIFSRNVKTCE